MYKKKAAIITLLFSLNALISIATQVVIAKIFGATAGLDNFLVAVTLPTVVITLSYATVNDAFLPVYTEWNNNKGGKIAAALAGSWFKHLFLVGAFFFLLVLFLPGTVIRLLFGTHTENTITHLRIMSPALLIGLVNALLMSIAYYRQKYYTPPAIQVVGAIINFVGIYYLFPFVNEYALSVGFVLGIAVQLFLLLSYFRELDLRARLTEASFLYPLWIPLILATLFFRADSWILRISVTGVMEGAVSLVNYAARMFALSAGIITSGLKVLLLPLLSESYAQSNWQRFKALIRKSQLAALVLTTVSVVAIVLLRKPLIEFLFLRGRFTSADASIVASLIVYFIPAAIGWGLFQVVATPFFAVKKQKIIAVVTAIGLIFAYLFTLLFKSSMGILTAPFAVGIMLMFDVIVLSGIWYLYEKKFVGKK